MNSMVIVIDVQRGLFEENPRPYEADEVIQRINTVTDKARIFGIPLLFFQSEIPGFLDYGTERWQLASALVFQEGDQKLRKSKANAFLETNLEKKLNAIGVSNLIICGYATEFCIDSTVRFASALGYTIQLVADAHTTVDKEHLSAKKIRQHHNITLAMGSSVTAIESTNLVFGEHK